MTELSPADSAGQTGKNRRAAAQAGSFAPGAPGTQRDAIAAPVSPNAAAEGCRILILVRACRSRSACSGYLISSPGAERRCPQQLLSVSSAVTGAYSCGPALIRADRRR